MIRRLLRRRPARGIAVLCFALVSAAPLPAQTDKITTPPADPDKNWTLGLAQFVTVNVSAQNLYLAASFPLQLKERIIGLRTHRLSPEELLSLKSLIINKELKKEISSLLALQKTRDAALFNETKDFMKRKINDDYLAASTQTRARISFLRGLDSADVSVSGEKPIVLKDNNGQLFPPPPFSPFRYCDEIGVDALLWGSVEEIQGYLYCELHLFSRILEKDIFSLKEAGRPEELFASLEKAVPELKSALVGREWADLVVDVEPAFSFIKINGKLEGMGTVHIPDLPPGEMTLDIESPGYSGISEKIILAPREMKLARYSLSKSDEQFILINSVPPQANVYLNSQWIGTTPLVIEKPSLLTRLSLTLSGFQDAFERVGPASPPALHFSLLKTAVDFEAIKSSKRWRYYTSLGAFVLSVPFPIFSFGLMRDYYQAGMMDKYEFFSASYYFTFFITGALFVNMMYDLFRYLNSRDETVG